MIDETALASIERLHKMKADGILSEEEFEEAKADLLKGERPAASRAGQGDKFNATPDENDFLAWALLPLRRYADFTGRSSRREFWSFFGSAVGLVLALMLVTAADTGVYDNVGLIGNLALVSSALILLATLVPTFAIQARRFHDQGKSGWFVLLNLIPYIGVFIVLAFMFVPGHEGENEYGPDPIP